MSKQLIVKKDNALINASYTLTLAEQRLILLAVAEAGGSPERLKDTAIHAHSYAKNFGVADHTAYVALSNASDHLFERYFRYQKRTEKGNIEEVKSRWVQAVSYVKSEGTIKIKFADDVLPLLCELQTRFTAYNLESVSGLSSAYAIRLYELIVAWKTTGKTPEFLLEDLRQKLGVLPSEYGRMADFKRRVLDNAVKQINKHTDLKIKYEQHKAGRTITGFTFYVAQEKPAITTESTRCDKTGELGLNEPLTPQQIGYYAKLLGQSSWANHAKILQGVESKDVFSVIMRHLKNPEFYEKHKDKIDELKNANKAQK